jgi:hypothetical protein
MSEFLIQSETLDEIADAINAKTGGSSAMTPAEMVTAIGSISGGGETDLTPFFAVAGEVTPTSDSSSLAFPTDGVLSSVGNVIFFLAYVDDYTQFTEENDMIVGAYKANIQFKVPVGNKLQAIIQTIDTSRNPPLNYWGSTTRESISGNNYVISTNRNSYFKSGVKYTYILAGVSA